MNNVVTRKLLVQNYDLAERKVVTTEFTVRLETTEEGRKYLVSEKGVRYAMVCPAGGKQDQVFCLENPAFLPMDLYDMTHKMWTCCGKELAPTGA